MRALWDYYKINGIIESKYCQLKKGGDQEGRFDGCFLGGCSKSYQILLTLRRTGRGKFFNAETKETIAAKKLVRLNRIPHKLGR